MSQSKLQQLAEIEGYDDPFDMLGEYTCDSVCPGICMEDGCDYTNEVEPDCCTGWCENCEKGTVQSAMILAGII